MTNVAFPPKRKNNNKTLGICSKKLKNKNNITCFSLIMSLQPNLVTRFFYKYFQDVERD